VAASVTNPIVNIPSKPGLAWLAGWTEIQPAFLRTYINLPERTEIEIPSAPPAPPIIGNRIVFDGCFTCLPPGVPWTKDVTTISFFDVEGSGLSSFRIIEERLNKFGQLHRALGLAQLEATGTDLYVKNLVSGPDNPAGVEFNSGSTSYEASTYVPPHVFWRPINSFGTVFPGAILRASVRGAFVNQGEQLLASSQITDLGSTKEITADHSALGATSRIVEVLSSNVVVYSANIVGSNGVVAHVSSWAEGWGTVADFSVNCPVWRFWPTTLFEVNNHSVAGDEIRIAPVGGTTPDHLSSFSLQAAGIPELELSAESVEATSPITMQIQRFGNAVAISWTPTGSGQVLQCANRVTGPYWEVPGGDAGSYVTSIGAKNQFYRVVQR
jgi:hypothetical protein